MLKRGASLSAGALRVSGSVTIPYEVIEITDCDGNTTWQPVVSGKPVWEAGPGKGSSLSHTGGYGHSPGWTRTEILGDTGRYWGDAAFNFAQRVNAKQAENWATASHGL